MLKDLYADLECNNAGSCSGCSIYGTGRAVKRCLDYETKGSSDVLFLADCFKIQSGSQVDFLDSELEIIKSVCKVPFITSVAVKCSGVKEPDMNPTNSNICREYLSNTIDKIRPKLVFSCGNLPLKMLLKKSGIKDKRGNIYEYTTDTGYTCKVMPILPPYMVIAEPKYLELFRKDIFSGIEKVLNSNVSDYDFSYCEVNSEADVAEMLRSIGETSDPIAFDLETTGLDFLNDKVMTIAISSSAGTWAIPVEHRDSPWADKVSVLLPALKKIFSNPNNRKIGHNVKFDIKFLKNYGISVTNPYDTKVMHRIINENLPNSLSELVKIYFPLFSVEHARNS